MLEQGDERRMIYTYYTYYTHCRCKCGGIIGMKNKKIGYECERCHKNYNKSLKYDWLALNSKTNWIFPMIRKEVQNAGSRR